MGLISKTANVHPFAVINMDAYIGDFVVIHEGVHVGPDVVIWDHAVIGRPTMRPGDPPVISVLNPTIIGPGSVIGAGATIYAGVNIAARVLIGDGARIRENCLIENDCIVGSNCTFQNDVWMQQGARVIDLSHITAGVVIAKGAFVSTGVLTMNDDSFAGNNKEHETELRPPFIGSHASIGGGAILLPGVIVGEGAIVGAGSVVTKDVEPKTKVIGVPAKRRYPPPTREDERFL